MVAVGHYTETAVCKPHCCGVYVVMTEGGVVIIEMSTM